MVLFSIVFIFLFNSQLGLSRDWDVLALMSFPFMIFILIFLSEQIEFNSIKRAYLSLAYICVWQTAIWIFLNWNVNISEARNLNLNNDKFWEKSKTALYFEETGSYYRNNGNYSEAEVRYKKGLEYNPENLRIVINLSGIYYKQNRYLEAEGILENTINRGIDDRKVMVNLGVLEIKLKNYDKAISVFERCVQKDSTDYEALGNISTCYSLKHEYNKSIEYSEKVAKIAPGYPLPYLSLGDSYLALGDTLKAINNYQRAKNLDKDLKFKDLIEGRLENINNK